MSMTGRVAPYVEQLLEDDDIQANLLRSVRRARQAYAAITANKNAKKAVEDRRVRLRLRQSVAAARDAAIALRQGPEKQQRRRRRVRLLVVVIAGGALVTLNESVRAEMARRWREISESSPP